METHTHIHARAVNMIKCTINRSEKDMPWLLRTVSTGVRRNSDAEHEVALKHSGGSSGILNPGGVQRDEKLARVRRREARTHSYRIPHTRLTENYRRRAFLNRPSARRADRISLIEASSKYSLNIERCSTMQVTAGGRKREKKGDGDEGRKTLGSRIQTT